MQVAKEAQLQRGQAGTSLEPESAAKTCQPAPDGASRANERIGISIHRYKATTYYFPQKTTGKSRVTTIY